MEYRPSPPVKEGDEFKVIIECYGRDGDGIAHLAGFTIIIPKTKLDEEVNIKITKVRDTFAFAEVITEGVD